MSNRPALQWNDERPDLFRARGRSGRVYRIGRDGPGDWTLRVAAGDDETYLSRGTLADMKALANIDEAEHAPPSAPRRITWTRIGNGHWWGTQEAIGSTAYKVLKAGRICGETIWRLEEYANEDAERGATIDEGPLAAMKRRAARHAGEVQP